MKAVIIMGSKSDLDYCMKIARKNQAVWDRVCFKGGFSTQNT